MAKKWVTSVVCAFAVLSISGIGFAAFTATATVNGTASAGTMGLEIISAVGADCGSLFGATAPGAGNFTFFDLNPGHTSISARATNLTPGVYCEGGLELQNTGSVPVTVGVELSTPGLNGICTSYARNCYDVESLSGIEASGWQWYIGSPTAGTSSYGDANFATLNPGATYTDYLAVNLPELSTSALTPSGATFTIVYTATAGV